MKTTKRQDNISLSQWIWRSFRDFALIPTIALVLLLLGAQFFVQEISKSSMVDHLRSLTENRLAETANEKADTISQQFIGVANTTDFYRNQSARALATTTPFSPEDEARLAYSPEGAYYTTRDKAVSAPAVFYSGIQPVGEKERQKVANYLALQDTMTDILKAEPLAASAYINTWDSLCVIAHTSIRSASTPSSSISPSSTSTMERMRPTIRTGASAGPTPTWIPQATDG